LLSIGPVEEDKGTSPALIEKIFVGIIMVVGQLKYQKVYRLIVFIIIVFIEASFCCRTMFMARYIFPILIAMKAVLMAVTCFDLG